MRRDTPVRSAACPHPAGRARSGTEAGAGNRTRDHLLTMQVRYRCATPARWFPPHATPECGGNVGENRKRLLFLAYLCGLAAYESFLTIEKSAIGRSWQKVAEPGQPCGVRRGSGSLSRIAKTPPFWSRCGGNVGETASGGRR